MKKRPLLFLLIIIFCFMIVGCKSKTKEPINNPTDYLYTLKIENNITGISKEYLFAKNMVTISEIEEVTKYSKSNQKFVGYSSRKSGNDLFYDDDSIVITDTVKLYSIWEEYDMSLDNEFCIDDIGEIRLNVGNAITSKEDYENGTIEINSKNYNLDQTNIRIRLRGNSSLSAPKKSYKIKFDEKQNLFGFGKDKEWALIANYFDCSLLRNYYAYKFAKAIGIDYSVDCKLVEVYLNGVDQGLYLLTETVKTGKERVNIEVDYTAEDIEIPFLLELDMKMTSEDDPLSAGVLDQDYFIVDIPHFKFDNYPIATKYPDTYTLDDITSEQYEYIKDYIRKAFNSVYSDEYKNYYDVKSVIDYFLVEDLFMNIDQDYSSVYFYKPVGDKIHYGPVWDFDISLGNANYYDKYEPEMFMKDVNTGSRTFNELMKKEEFRNQFMERLEEVEPIFDEMMESFNYNYEMIKDKAANDNAIWNTLNKAYWPKPSHLVGISYKEQVDYIIDFLEKHYNFMKNNY